MNYLLSSFILFTLIGCNLAPQQFSLSTNSCATETSATKYISHEDLFASNWDQIRQKKELEPYDLKLRIEQTKSDEFTLIISMDLSKDSYFISPNSGGDFTGKFGTCMGKNIHLKSNGKMEEFPKSIESFNPFGNSKANFIYKDTRYEQKYTFNPKEDFKVEGHIHFTIEPQCTFEEISYTITHKSGKLTVTKYKC
jgi:hypothetical protein